jgi:hypothetical protein
VSYEFVIVVMRERTLEDFEVLDICVFAFSIELDPCHGNIHCQMINTIPILARGKTYRRYCQKSDRRQHCTILLESSSFLLSDKFDTLFHIAQPL